MANAFRKYFQCSKMRQMREKRQFLNFATSRKSHSTTNCGVTQITNLPESTSEAGNTPQQYLATHYSDCFATVTLQSTHLLH